MECSLVVECGWVWKEEDEEEEEEEMVIRQTGSTYVGRWMFRLCVCVRTYLSDWWEWVTSRDDTSTGLTSGSADYEVICPTGRKVINKNTFISKIISSNYLMRESAEWAINSLIVHRCLRRPYVYLLSDYQRILFNLISRSTTSLEYLRRLIRKSKLNLMQLGMRLTSTSWLVPWMSAVTQLV